MNAFTKHLAIFAIMYSLILGIFYGVSVHTVQSQITELKDLREAVAEQTVKESAYNILLSTLEETTIARSELSSRFLTQRDTVTFITEIEEEARLRGLEINTTNLALTEGTDDDFDTLLVSFQVLGQQTAVKDFLSLLELLPYHKVISNLNLRRQPNATEWQGEISIIFTLLP